MDNEAMPVFGQCPTGIACQPRQAAYCVVVNDERRVAVIGVNVRGCEEYWLPGGGIDDCETSEQAVHREFDEELGCEVRLLSRLGPARQFFYAGDEDRWYDMRAQFFVGEFTTWPSGKGEFDLQWADLGDPKALFFHECHRWAANKAITDR